MIGTAGIPAPPELLRGVLLDDGTLIDSNGAHAASWSAALATAGLQVPAERVRPLIGMGGDKLIPIVTGWPEEDERAQRIVEVRREIFHTEHLPRLRAFPGAAELVERLLADELRLVVASSARRSELDAMLAQVRLDHLIEMTTSSSDAEESKPDPDIIEAALHRGNLRAEQVLMVGDTPYDVEAAQRAGVATVALRCGGWDDAGLSGALVIYDDPADVLRGYEASPFRLWRTRG